MIVPARLEPVQRVFEAALASGEALGARFTLVQEGAVVLDLWGGHADKARTRPFDARTLVPVFSVSKAMVAVLMARLVDQGRLDYQQTVASVWPEFAQAGKAEVTVGQALSHQAGLPGFPEPMDPALWFDWDAICTRLAAMAPMWRPGSASGYHPVTFGHIAGEIFRRVDGRSIGRALRQDVAGPCGLDLWIGLPDSEFDRVAQLDRPKTLPDFGRIDDIKRAAFLTAWASPGGRGAEAWRRAEFPAANGHATAEALARLMAVMAGGGVLAGERLLSPEVVALASAERIRGDDLVLPFALSWAAGLMRNPPNTVFGPGERSVGHYGWGGACAFADPDRRLSGAYVMNRQSSHLIGDPRAMRLIEAAYGCL